MILLLPVDLFIDRAQVMAALDEKQAARSLVYNANFMHALESGVDETTVLLYAQCALNEFDKGNIQ